LFAGQLKIVFNPLPGFGELTTGDDFIAESNPGVNKPSRITGFRNGIANAGQASSKSFSRDRIFISSSVILCLSKNLVFSAGCSSN
jgi:hypothetical protein